MIFTLCFYVQCDKIILYMMTEIGVAQGEGRTRCATF